MVEVVLVLLAPLLLVTLGRLELLLGSPAFGVCLRGRMLTGGLRPPGDDHSGGEERDSNSHKDQDGEHTATLPCSCRRH
jgi:hypothetical protein